MNFYLNAEGMSWICNCGSGMVVRDTSKFLGNGFESHILKRKKSPTLVVLKV